MVIFYICYTSWKFSQTFIWNSKLVTSYIQYILSKYNTNQYCFSYTFFIFPHSNWWIRLFSYSCMLERIKYVFSAACKQDTIEITTLAIFWICLAKSDVNAASCVLSHAISARTASHVAGCFRCSWIKRRFCGNICGGVLWFSYIWSALEEFISTHVTGNDRRFCVFN